MNIYFWQQIVTPHMAALAHAAARRGHHVTYVASALMSESRAAQGWQATDVGSVNLTIASHLPDVMQVVANAPAHAIHVTEGVRGNGLVGGAQRLLRDRGARMWVVHEKIDDRGLIRCPKRAVYRWMYRRIASSTERLLAIGDGTQAWAAARGFPPSRISPFAYFLAPDELPIEPKKGPFTFCYAGQLIPRKRLDLLLDALDSVDLRPWALEIVGDGELGPQLRNRVGEAKYHESVTWRGVLSNAKARRIIATADCLILPSDHDGWGAVAGEALLAGTRVICASACGSAAAVREDSLSRIFQAGSVGDLRSAITETLSFGNVSPEEREQRRCWATSALAATAGAEYLEALIEGREMPAPWVSPRHSTRTPRL